MASRTLVLPCPLSPYRTLKRGCGCHFTRRKLRNPSAAMAWNSKEVSRPRRRGSEPHRHDDAQVVLPRPALLRPGPQHAGVELAGQLELDFLAVHLAQEIDQVVGVEPDGEVAAVVADVEFLLALAEVGV